MTHYKESASASAISELEELEEQDAINGAFSPEEIASLIRDLPLTLDPNWTGQINRALAFHLAEELSEEEVSTLQRFTDKVQQYTRMKPSANLTLSGHSLPGTPYSQE